MEALLTLTQAGDRLGVDGDALNRLIRDGALPEARQLRPVAGGDLVWVIPSEHLGQIAARNGWTIDLRQDAPSAPPVGRDESARFVRAIPQSTGMAADQTKPQPATTPPGTAQPAIQPDDIASQMPNANAAKAQQAGAEPPSQPTDPMIASPVASARVAPANTVEVETELVASRATQPSAEIISAQEARNVPSVSDVIDMELLDRLLGAQESKAVAKAEMEHTRSALETLNVAHSRITDELEIERRERMIAAERFREERLARAQSEAKVVELRDRVTREMALAEAEKAARNAALDRVAQVEREAADAYAALGWRARRRLRRIDR